MVILDQMGDLEVFVGHHIVRLDQRPRCFKSEVFPLPTYSQTALRQSFHRLLAVHVPLDFAGDAPMPALEFGFGLPEIAWVGNGGPIAVGVEGFQPYINAHPFAGRDVLNLTEGERESPGA